MTEEPIHRRARMFRSDVLRTGDSELQCTPNARLSREELQMVLAEMRNDTEYGAVVTQLRSAWDDQDPRERDRRGKCLGKSGRTVRFCRR